MRKLVSLLFLALCLGGCVIIALPRVEPLAEKIVEGKGDNKVLLMDISGVITDDGSENILGQQAPSLTARIKEELDLAAKDPLVKALVLRINTPGGSVTTCDIITHELQKFKKKKNVPVVAELMDVAASGGYYIAASADTIIAHPTTVTGSIGVVAYSVEASGLMSMLGISNQTIKSGEMKDIGSPLRPMTEDEKKVLRSVIDNMYERFLDVIMDGRKGLDRDELRKVADGRIFSASQAKELKLVDSIGYLDDAISSAKKRAGLEDATIVTYSQPRAYKNNIYSGAPQLPAEVNIVKVDSSFSKKFGMSFMYIWMP